MNPTSSRMAAALAAVLMTSFFAGCGYSIMPIDKGKLLSVISLSAVHDTVVATAATAPVSAEGPYDKLRKDFNALIDQQQDRIEYLSRTVLLTSKVDLTDLDPATDQNIRSDLAAFAAAAPDIRSGPVLIGALDTVQVLTAKIEPEVGGIPDSRPDQTRTFNQELEKLKLPPWERVNRPQTGTR